ncbi:helix-turn-helix domain-containing protein [Colwellia sp. 75C3]|uniref:helix-turn-helix domain-containing protein n=1 Tax=Colwellia sp. 75C3 TaxID=888425 RepID=UPI003FA49E0B
MQININVIKTQRNNRAWSQTQLGDVSGLSLRTIQRIENTGVAFLVGLSSWQLGYGDISTFKGGLYGTTAYQVRLSNYHVWILGVLGG